MMFKRLGLICSLILLANVWAQTPMPLTTEDFKTAMINLRIEPSPEEIQKAKADLLTKRLNEQFSSNNVSNNQSNNSYQQNERLKEFVDCIQNAVKSNLAKGLNCRDDWKALMKGDIEELKKRGLPLPDDFVVRMKNELKTLQDEFAAYNREDEVIVIDEYMSFEAASADTILNAQSFDPNIVSLSQNMKEIVLKMYKSDDPIKAIAGLKEKKSGEVPDELFVLGEMLELITGANCDKEASYSNGSGQYLLKDLALKIQKEEVDKNKKDKPKSKFVGNYLIGVKTDEPLTSVPTYRFTEDGITYFLYQGKKRASEEVWVMAKLLPDGKLEYNYFKLIKDQPAKTAIKSKDDIALFQSGVHQTSSKLPNNNKFYFQAQEGLVIQTDEISAPVIGKAIIPEAKLVISRVHMAYLGKNNISQANVSVRHDSVLLETQSKPLSGMWSIGSDVRYSPINGNWNVNSNIRVQNLLVGYGINSSGDSSANVSYIISRNFATIQTDIKNNAQMTLGRQFSNSRGYVMASTNFKSIAEVKLILIVK